MGFLDEIREIIRRGATGDKWYVNGERLYVLELRAPPTGPFFIAPVTYIVLPLGLQGYRTSRVYRAAASPTIGGIVAEERGELWKKLSIKWDPGIEPKKSIDTSFLPDVYSPGFALSGPAWSRRLMRNYFDNYSKLKSDPQYARDTYMIWHDLKTDDHYVIMPTEATVDRAPAISSPRSAMSSARSTKG